MLGWSWAGSLAVMTALLWLRAGLAASGALLRRACFKPAAVAAGAPEGGGCRHRLGRWRAVWSGEDEAALRWRRADAAMLLLLYALGVAAIFVTAIVPSFSCRPIYATRREI